MKGVEMVHLFKEIQDSEQSAFWLFVCNEEPYKDFPFILYC